MVDGRAPTVRDLANGGTPLGPSDTGGTLLSGGTAEIGSSGAGGNWRNDLEGGSADVSIAIDLPSVGGSNLPSVGGSNLPSVGGSGGTTLGSGGVMASGGVARDSASLSTGGTSGAGGSTTTTSEAPPVPINCANPIVPDNGTPLTNGVVTDFSRWDPANPVWGRSTNLSGTLFKNTGNGATIGDPKVEGNPPGMNLAGAIPVSSTGGGGLQFATCATVKSFNNVRFTYYGSAPGCKVDLLIHTFSESTAGGGCGLDGGGNCNDFPRLNGIVDVTTAASSPTLVSKPLSSFKSSNASWSTADAGQVVGIEWRFTNASTASPCNVDFTVTNIAFLP
jgi:hypothetical protein